MDIFRYLDVPLILVAVAVAALATAAAAVPALRRGDRRGAARRCVRVLLAGAVACVLVMTLVAGSAWGSGYNLVPGATITEQLRSANGSLALGNLALGNLLGNVAVFLPIGLLGSLASRCAPRTVIASGAALSTAIELVQYGTGRSADIDDVLLNTVGVALGVLVAVAGLRLTGTVRTGTVRGAR